MAIGRNDYEERKERKIEAYENRAVKANALSANLLNRASEIGSVIPFGQPILIGHHSEKRHRATIKKINSATQKSIEAADKAAYYEGRAETAANNSSISGDDPEAVKKYKEKLTNLETLQNNMKAVNKASKKGKDALLKKMQELNFSGHFIEVLLMNMEKYENGVPFAAWRLSNNNAEIRRIKEKIKSLEKLNNMEAVTTTFNGGILQINIEINRVQFLFDDKPSAEIRTMLKRSGFRWAPSEGAWQRQRTANAISEAKCLIKQFEGVFK